MSAVIHRTHCPVCNAAAFSPVFSAVDKTVSGESFLICECSNCTLRFTQDVPTEDEIARYYKAETYISHTNTGKGIVNKLYKQVRSVTLRQKRNLVEQMVALQQGTLLDVGAGTGAFLAEMQAHSWKVKGIEPGAGARQVALEQFNVLLDPPENISEFLEGHFNAITMWHVLEHVHNLKPMLNRLHELLAPGGALFVAVPNYLSADAKRYGSAWAAYDVPRHLYHFSPHSMRVLLEACGFRVARIEPMKFDSFYVSMLSEQNAGKNLGLLRGFASGLVSNLKAGKESYSSLIYVAQKRQ